MISVFYMHKLGEKSSHTNFEHNFKNPYSRSPLNYTAWDLPLRPIFKMAS